MIDMEELNQKLIEGIGMPIEPPPITPTTLWQGFMLAVRDYLDPPEGRPFKRALTFWCADGGCIKGKVSFREIVSEQRGIQHV